MQGLDGKGARIERLKLPGLQASKYRQNRLAVACWMEGEAVRLRIEDIGWGELQKGTGMEWEFEIRGEPSAG